MNLINLLHRLSKAIGTAEYFGRIEKKGKPWFRRIFRPRAVYLLWPGKKPISRVYGAERGQLIDRYYIEKFLAKNKDAIFGKVMEIQDDRYTATFGEDRVTKADILDIDRKNKRATIYGDLRKLTNVTNSQYDCLILTQVLHLIDDMDSAISECKRILKPGGTLLVTVPTISRIDVAAGVKGDFWRLTSASAQYLFGKHFSKEKLVIEEWGNVVSGMGFWVGLAREELSPEELSAKDENFPCVITIRATR